MEDNILGRILGGDAAAQQDLMKALTAGSQTGIQYAGQTMAGVGGLKIESLDSMVRVLEMGMQHIKLFGMLPKQDITNNIHQYNLLVKYGGDENPFMDEGGSPVETDSQYRRESVAVKYLGVGGKLTDQAMQVARSDGKDQYAAEVENKTMHLLRKIAENLTEANSKIVPNQFDGIWAQHYNGINAMHLTTSLDNYFDDPCVIDARGRALDDIMVQNAAHGVINDRFGMASKIIAPPVVFKDYATRYQDQKRFIVGQNGSITNATTGQSITSIQSQFGPLAMDYDIFMDKRTAKAQNAPAGSNTNVPVNPVKDGSAPATAYTNTSTRFSDSAGNYLYGVTGKNKYGESAMVMLTAAQLAVTTTQAVKLKFAAGSGNAATGFVIYRSEKNDTGANAKLYPIFEISAAEHAAGYDGGSATEVVDRNLFISNTHSAMVVDPSTQMWEYLQLGGTRRVDFAQIELARKFAVVNYGTPVLYQPGKVARIINIGSTIS